MFILKCYYLVPRIVRSSRWANRSTNLAWLQFFSPRPAAWAMPVFTGVPCFRASTPHGPRCLRLARQPLAIQLEHIHNTDGRAFAYIRSSRGGTTGYYNQSDPNNNNGLNDASMRYDDPYFVQNITNATNAGMFAGPYHFGRMDIIDSTPTGARNGKTPGTDEGITSSKWRRVDAARPTCSPCSISKPATRRAHLRVGPIRNRLLR